MVAEQKRKMQTVVLRAWGEVSVGESGCGALLRKSASGPDGAAAVKRTKGAGDPAEDRECEEFCWGCHCQCPRRLAHQEAGGSELAFRRATGLETQVWALTTGNSRGFLTRGCARGSLRKWDPGGRRAFTTQTLNMSLLKMHFSVQTLSVTHLDTNRQVSVSFLLLKST